MSEKQRPKFIQKLFSAANNFTSLVMAFFITLLILGVMAGVVYFSMILSTKSLKNLAIVFSSTVCSILSIPLTLIWTPRIRELIRKSDDKNKIIIGEQKTEIKNLQQQIEEQKNQSEDLQNKIHLLENLVFVSNNSVDILKVGYKEFTKVSTIRVRTKINESEGKIFSPASYDEVILILDCRTKYQRGIDFNKLRLAYSGSNKDSVVVTNLKPEYTNAPIFEYETFFSEMRHVEIDKNGNDKKVSIMKGPAVEKKISEIENQNKEYFESSFMSDENFESVQEINEIVKISKDCIRLLLKPYFSKIDFDTHCEIKDAKPWSDFLQNKVENLKLLESK